MKELKFSDGHISHVDDRTAQLINELVNKKRIADDSVKLLSSVTSPLIKTMISEKVGREIIFDSMPKNELVVAKTSEGINYVVNTSDRVIGRSVYVNKQSHDAHHLTKALSLIPGRKTLLLDVGANIGTIGILGIFKGYFEKCIAFEPEPNNFKLLRLNVLLNGLDEKFELRNEALSNEKTSSLDFELSETNYGDHRVRLQKAPGLHKEDNRKVISVNVNTLDLALDGYENDECVLFMDTQGFEGHVLNGAKNLIKKSIPIVSEFWPYGLNRSNGIELFYDVLSNSDYTAMWDLKNPGVKMKFSIDEMRKIAFNLGEKGNFTDLLFINEKKE